MVYLTKTVSFSAAHRLYNPAWSLETNLEVFGKCANPGGHGHNYRLEVTLRGRPDPETGMVINLREVKRVVMEHFWEKCDHRDFNHDVEFMRGRIPTSENVVMAAWEVLEPEFPPGSLYRLRLFETEDNAVEYFGPERTGDGSPSTGA